MRSVYVCAGGTGGHVFPAIAVFEKIDDNKMFITDERGLKFTFAGVSSNQVVLLKTIRLKLAFIIEAIYNIVFLFLCFLKNRPSSIICFGGIVTIAPALIAKLFGAKIFLHEQNSVMGRANRFLKVFAEEVFLAYKNTKHAGNCTYVGMPIRRSISECDYDLAGKFVIFVIGGSQGAHFFANLMCDVVGILNKDILSEIKIFHQVRPDDIATVKSCYNEYGIDAVVESFFYDVFAIYKQTNLLIARAGATTLGEICIVKIPAILIPFNGSAGNHQYENAKFYQQHSVCEVVLENDQSYVVIANILKELLIDRNKLLKYRENFSKINMKRGEDLMVEKIGVICER